MQLGFVGLGKMGLNMVTRLAGKGQNHTPASVPCSYSQESGTANFGDSAGDSNGAMRPLSNMWPVNPLPDGINIAYSNGTAFYQILAATLLPNTIYTLKASAGERADVGQRGYVENQGYYMELSVDTGGGYGARSVRDRKVT